MLPSTGIICQFFEAQPWFLNESSKKTTRDESVVSENQKTIARRRVLPMPSMSASDNLTHSVTFGFARPEIVGSLTARADLESTSSRSGVYPVIHSHNNTPRICCLSNHIGTHYGTSSVYIPSACALAAFLCDRSANSSCACLLIPNLRWKLSHEENGGDGRQEKGGSGSFLAVVRNSTTCTQCERP